jgi:hypothetical protein
MLQHDVRVQLRAPSTAGFPDRYEPGTKHLGDCIYQLFSRVDGKNGFCAMLPSTLERPLPARFDRLQPPRFMGPELQAETERKL